MESISELISLVFFSRVRNWVSVKRNELRNTIVSRGIIGQIPRLRNLFKVFHKVTGANAYPHERVHSFQKDHGIIQPMNSAPVSRELKLSSMLLVRKL